MANLLTGFAVDASLISQWKNNDKRGETIYSTLGGLTI